MVRPCLSLRTHLRRVKSINEVKISCKGAVFGESMERLSGSYIDVLAHCLAAEKEKTKSSKSCTMFTEQGVPERRPLLF